MISRKYSCFTCSLNTLGDYRRPKATSSISDGSPGPVLNIDRKEKPTNDAITLDAKEGSKLC